MSGIVTLVGAGPGDPGLLTLRGKEALEQADVVVYDRLINPVLLKWASPKARLIDVGKNAGHHPVPQEEINRILLKEAENGCSVVRLKGGDPFLFGRGGEELELLAQNGIDFEVVPGVTSAIAVPGYAGIPVTDRDRSSSVHIIAGRLRDGSPRQLDYEALVRSGGTLVFLMGVKALPRLCEGLLKAGMPPDMPAAMIENGTLPDQRKILASVGTLANKAAEAGIRSPAISVFGKVCELSESLDWFERLPLHGKTVIVTRPSERMGDLPCRLQQLGARVIEYPCIVTVPCANRAPLQEAIKTLRNYKWIVFTSPGGPKYFFNALFDQGLDVRALGGIRLAAIGPKTADALIKYGVRADLIPGEYNSNALSESLCREADGPVLLCRSSIASPEIPAQLRKQGIPFSDVPCYDTRYEAPENADVLCALRQGHPYVTFTSASTVRGFVNSLPPGTDLSGILGCCIGERARREAERHHIPAVAAEESTIECLIERMIKEAKQ